jgi:hypothetical protein
MRDRLLSGILAILVLLITAVAFAAPKGAAESIQIQVVSTKTNFHGASPNVFKYTEVIFGRVGGKNLVFVCEQKNDECPLMQDGKTYSADRVGGLVYFSMGAPDVKKNVPIKFRQTGTW